MVDMSEAVAAFICQVSGAEGIRSTRVIQSLWSGYGAIVRCELRGAALTSVVVKHIRLQGPEAHPRGWNTDLSHQRKLRSYAVESAWYQHWAGRCDGDCRVPQCLGLSRIDDCLVLVLEDLDATGFSGRRRSSAMAPVLRWLAHFHATFMGVDHGTEAQQLWPQGSYWHLATRPDELEKLGADPLRQHAAAIDALLEASPHKTLIHGDAKLDNFCFGEGLNGVAAVDFQYVGHGCGMKDVAYFISSCLDETDCERREGELLDCYFAYLREALHQRQPHIDAAAVEADWRRLYPVAWADFYRFLKGWSPGHWKMHPYSEGLTREVIAAL